MENSRKKLLTDEIKCLELTLAKRKAQLREADRLLKECNTDLKCARDEVSFAQTSSYCLSVLHFIIDDNKVKTNHTGKIFVVVSLQLIEVSVTFSIYSQTKRKANDLLI